MEKPREPNVRPQAIAYLQQPDNLGPSLAATKSDDMTTDGVVEERPLVFVGLQHAWVSAGATRQIEDAYIRKHTRNELAACHR